MRILIYFFPIAINILIGGMFFISAYRFKLAEAPGWVIGATMAAWALIYSIVTLGLSKCLTIRNAPVILNIGCAILVASSVGFLVLDGLYTQFLCAFSNPDEVGGAGSGICRQRPGRRDVHLCVEYRDRYRTAAFRGV